MENVADDSDVTISATRTLLGELCEGEAKSLKELIQTSLQEANVNDTDNKLTSVEVLGGGCRIPLFQTCIQGIFTYPIVGRTTNCAFLKGSIVIHRKRSRQKRRT